MEQSRRDALRIASALALALGAGLLKPSEVFAAEDADDTGITRTADPVPWGSDWNGAVYSAKSLEAFVIAMSGDTTTPNTPRTVVERGKVPGLFLAKSGELIIEAPELAENGTNVPVTLTSHIPNTDFMALLADLNPNPVCVGFHVMPDNDPSYAVRIKVAETSNLVAVARSGGKWFYSLRDITVMIGGCLG
ncbi:MAG: thiosulfate oxidation carrier protein SoxY [Oxalobacteraceae bacterium]